MMDPVDVTSGDCTVSHVDPPVVKRMHSEKMRLSDKYSLTRKSIDFQFANDLAKLQFDSKLEEAKKRVDCRSPVQISKGHAAGVVT
jgi:hypothetical protein